MPQFEDRQDIPMMMQIAAPIMVRRPRGRAAASISSRFDTRFKVLLDTKEKELLKQEADMLGITTAEFIRHCALQSAKFLQKYRENYHEQQAAQGLSSHDDATT